MMDKLLMQYFIKQENLNSDFEFWKSRIFKKYLTDKYFKGGFNEYFDYITNVKITWKDTKLELSSEWWVKTAFVNNKPRFELFCSKDVKIFLLDLKNGSKIEIREGSISVGMRKVNEIILQ